MIDELVRFKDDERRIAFVDAMVEKHPTILAVSGLLEIGMFLGPAVYCHVFKLYKLQGTVSVYHTLAAVIYAMPNAKVDELRVCLAHVFAVWPLDQNSVKWIQTRRFSDWNLLSRALLVALFDYHPLFQMMFVSSGWTLLPMDLLGEVFEFM